MMQKSISNYLFDIYLQHIVNLKKGLMVQKFKDAANLLKAKIKQDELQQNLVQATSEENWQAPTALLHEIANAAYNYEKWQRISEFIWEKLKGKKSWRKILKTLNLVEFLLKNGPPNTISSFKYDLHYFRSFRDYTHFSDNLDKGQPIRERAKAIVDLLTNEELLEEERVKAKEIREKMSSVTGTQGGNYSQGGSFGGDAKYEGYSSKTYGKGKTGTTAVGPDGMVYGGYNYNKSTLDKYKDPSKKVSNKSANQPQVPSYAPTQPSKQEEQMVSAQVESKKPFEKAVKKLSKPGQKPPSSTTFEETAQKKEVTEVPAEKGNSGNLLDEEFLGMTVSEQPKQPSTEDVKGESLVNPMYSTTAPMAAQSIVSANPNLNQPAQNPHHIPGQTLNYSAQNYSYPPPPNMYPPQQQWGYSQNYPIQHQQPYMPNQLYPQAEQTRPHIPAQSQVAQAPVSLSTQVQATKKEDEFGSFETAQTTGNKNVTWLSNDEKNLIDFSDFADMKGGNTNSQKNANKNTNNIQVDPWNW